MCLHYHIIGKLILCLSEDDRTKVFHLYDYRLPDGSSPPDGHPRLKMGIIDAHIHLDELSRTISNLTLRTYEHLTAPPLCLRYVVANYVYPDRWNLVRKHLRLEFRIRVTLGVHPHMLYICSYEDLFRRLETQMEIPQGL